MSKKIFFGVACQSYSGFGFLSKVAKSARVVHTLHSIEWCSLGPVLANEDL